MNTITLNDMIKEYGINIFPFTYDFKPFKYGDKLIDKKELENKFINYYLYYEIAFETPQRFIFELQRIWQRNIFKFNQLFLKIPAEVELTENKRVTTESGNNNTVGTTSLNSSTDVTRDSIYSDTPNEPIDITTEDNYYTNRTIDNDTSNGVTKGQYSNDKTHSNENIEVFEINSMDKFLKISKKIDDVLYKFFDLFDDLFYKQIVIKNISNRGDIPCWIKVQ